MGQNITGINKQLPPPPSRTYRFFHRRVHAGKSQKVLGVGVADVFDHRANQIVVIRQQAVLDVAANEVAQGAAEVFVARIAHERAGIGDHADESREQAQTG